MGSEDTIAAIATAPGQAGIGIVRISGDRAIQVGEAVCRTPGGKSLNLLNAPTHTIHYGFVFDEGEMIDEVLVSVFRAPRSYTTEDTVEINTHGGIYLLQRVLSTVLKHGARPAEPGEFTKRAFFNGRIDLTRAESVMDLISSGNEFARKNALRTLRGSVYQKIRQLREVILGETAFIEAALDDPEHFSLDGYPERLQKTLEELLSEMDHILRNASNGKRLKDGIRICIAGKPNVGKSSLFNLLAGESRAIVTEIPGTTRDAVEVEIFSGGVSLKLIDTAGMRETEDTVEKIGVIKSREMIDSADLILLVLDASSPLDEKDREILELLKGKAFLPILNKQDLPQKLDPEELKPFTEIPPAGVSAKYDDNTEELEKVILSHFFSGGFRMNEEVYITNERQLAALRNAEESLKLVLRSIDAGVSEDFYTVDLMDAYGSLGEIIGEETGDDLADRIFQDFCMGK